MNTVRHLNQKKNKELLLKAAIMEIPRNSLLNLLS